MDMCIYVYLFQLLVLLKSSLVSHISSNTRPLQIDICSSDLGTSSKANNHISFLKMQMDH